MPHIFHGTLSGPSIHMRIKKILMDRNKDEQERHAIAVKGHTKTQQKAIVASEPIIFNEEKNADRYWNDSEKKKRKFGSNASDEFVDYKKQKREESLNVLLDSEEPLESIHSVDFAQPENEEESFSRSDNSMPQELAEEDSSFDNAMSAESLAEDPLLEDSSNNLAEYPGLLVEESSEEILTQVRSPNQAQDEAALRESKKEATSDLVKNRATVQLSNKTGPKHDSIQSQRAINKKSIVENEQSQEMVSQNEVAYMPDQDSSSPKKNSIAYSPENLLAESENSDSGVQRKAQDLSAAYTGLMADPTKETTEDHETDSFADLTSSFFMFDSVDDMVLSVPNESDQLDHQPAQEESFDSQNYLEAQAPKDLVQPDKDSGSTRLEINTENSKSGTNLDLATKSRSENSSKPADKTKAISPSSPEALFESIEESSQDILEEICKPSGKDPVNIEAINKVGVITVRSEVQTGYLLVAHPEGSNISISFIRKIQKTLQKNLKDKSISLNIETGFEVMIERVSFIVWAKARAKSCAVYQHGDNEIAVAFFAVNDIPEINKENEMSEVNVASLIPDVIVDFEGFIKLEKNEKMILYLKKERSISAIQKERLLAKNVLKIYLTHEDGIKCKAQFAQYFLNKKIKEFQAVASKSADAGQKSSKAAS